MEYFLAYSIFGALLQDSLKSINELIDASGSKVNREPLINLT